MKAIVVINLKTYKQGRDVIRLAKAIERVDRGVIIGVQASDIYEVHRASKLKVFAQHVDYQELGRNTGYIMPEAVKRDGAKGVFLNHSEHQLSFRIIKKTVKRCREVGLKVLIFAKSLKDAKKLKKLKPDYLAIEPPELVAGNKSVSTEKPELIEKIAKKLKRPFLVGAGVKTNDDIKIAMKLGARGIAVSSAITKAKNPGFALKKLLGKK
ncbi:triose-phosphate isomerase [Candidatus Pacearchaeota archaeon]|nr:triose-phosphate isomerase [Candidatus Pacearchaeota archaeon]